MWSNKIKRLRIDWVQVFIFIIIIIIIIYENKLMLFNCPCQKGKPQVFTKFKNNFLCDVKIHMIWRNISFNILLKEEFPTKYVFKEKKRQKMVPEKKKKCTFVMRKKKSPHNMCASANKFTRYIFTKNIICERRYIYILEI